MGRLTVWSTNTTLLRERPFNTSKWDNWVFLLKLIEWFLRRTVIFISLFLSDICPCKCIIIILQSRTYYIALVFLKYSIIPWILPTANSMYNSPFVYCYSSSPGKDIFLPEDKVLLNIYLQWVIYYMQIHIFV